MNRWLEYVEPEDLVKDVLIPEFVGRFPVLTSLTDLDESTLTRILTQPKNVLVKQDPALFGLDTIDLELPETAIATIARRALALRTIPEDVVLDLTHEMLARDGVTSVLITEEVIHGRGSLEICSSRPSH